MTGGRRFDVVVLGSGIAGLSAALAARRVGLSAIVLEKADVLGGGTCWSYGLIWVGMNHLAEAAGYADDAGEVLEYARFLCGGEGDDDRLLAYLGHAPDALCFFEAAGAEFKLVRGLTDHYYGAAAGARAEGRSLEAQLIAGSELGAWQHRIQLPLNHPWCVSAEEQVAWGGVSRAAEWDRDLVGQRRADDIRGMGVALVCQFLRALLAHDTPIEAGVDVKGLLTGDGRVTGVERADGQRIEAAKGVVLATGGYEANADMVARLERLPGWQPQYPDSVSGDGLTMGQEAGGALHMIPNNMQLFLCIRVPASGNRPAFTRLAGIVELFSPHTMVVNRQGQRFADESYFQGVAPALRRFDIATHDYANLPAWLIFDQAFVDRYAFAGFDPGSEMPDWVSRSETVEGLAGALGVDPTGLAATVDRFNGFARAGVDEDFHRGEYRWRLGRGAVAEGANPSLGEVSTPPFYGVQLYPTGAGSGGLLADSRARVVHLRGQPIPGLYAIGNTAAHTDYGTGYQAGQSLASAMTFSYLAAHHMAGLDPAPGRFTPGGAAILKAAAGV